MKRLVILAQTLSEKWQLGNETPVTSNKLTNAPADDNAAHELYPYFDSAEGQQITRKRALHELNRHGLTDHKAISEFFAEMGDQEFYDAQDVLRWLGY